MYIYISYKSRRVYIKNKIIYYYKFFFSSNKYNPILLKILNNILITFNIFTQQSTVKLLVHLRKLSFLLCANLQLSQTVNLGPEARATHGHIQSTDLLQLSRARLLRDLPATSEGSPDEAQGDIPGRGFRDNQ